MSNFKLDINESEEHVFRVINSLVSASCLIKQVNFFLRHPVYIIYILYIYIYIMLCYVYYMLCYVYYVML